MKPRPYSNPQTGRDEPPPGYKLTGSAGPDWRSLPRAWWGPDDLRLAEAQGRPMNLELPPPAPDRTLPAGFTLFPHITPRDTPGTRALREIRAAKVESALRKVGRRR